MNQITISDLTSYIFRVNTTLWTGLNTGHNWQKHPYPDEYTHICKSHLFLFPWKWSRAHTGQSCRDSSYATFCNAQTKTHNQMNCNGLTLIGTVLHISKSLAETTGGFHSKISYSTKYIFAKLKVSKTCDKTGSFSGKNPWLGSKCSLI